MATDKVRVTTHNGRIGKNGVYSAKHNDRNFSAGKAAHVDSERSSGNWYWRYYNDVKTNEACEKKFYNEFFKKHIKAQNKRNENGGHPERNKTVDQYRTSTATCPEEMILQIGTKDDGIKSDKLKEVCEAFFEWFEERFKNCCIVDASLHVDERGGPHVHCRWVWWATDKDNNFIVSQSKALKNMKIERPNPDKAEGKYNNPKITFTKLCREQFITICKEEGYNIEEEPKHKSEVGLDLVEYQTKNESEKLSILKTEIEMKEKELEAIRTKSYDIDANAKKTFGRVTLSADEYNTLIHTAQDVRDCYAKYEKLKEEYEILNKDYIALKKDKDYAVRCAQFDSMEEKTKLITQNKKLKSFAGLDPLMDYSNKMLERELKNKNRKSERIRTSDFEL